MREAMAAESKTCDSRDSALNECGDANSASGGYGDTRNGGRNGAGGSERDSARGDGRAKPGLLRALPTITEGVPGFAIAVAGLAFGMLAKESQKMPGFQSVSMGAPERWVPAVIALMPVIALMFAYRANPRFRLYRNPIMGFCIGGALLLSTLPATGTTVLTLPQEATFACRCISRSCELLMLLCWVEALLQLKARQVAAIVGAALIGIGGLDMALSMLKSDFASLLTACLAPLSMGLLYWFKDYNHFLSDSKAGAARPALGIDDSLRSAARSSTPAFAAALLMPFACYPFVLGSIHSTWLPQQSVASTTLYVQMGYAAGAICAGALCLYLVVSFWGRRKIELYNLIALPFLMLALYLTASSGGAYLLLYAFLQSFVEKLAMFLMFVAPFLLVTKHPAAMTWLVALILFEAGKLLASSLLTVLSPEIYSGCTIAAAFALSLASIGLVVIDGSKGSGEGLPEGAHENQAAAASGAALAEEVPLSSLSPTAAENLPDENGGSGAQNPFRETPAERIAREYRLTNREEEVLQLLAQGMTARAISEELVISPGTAKSHLRNIYAKLGVHTQSELILLVHEEPPSGQ